MGGYIERRSEESLPHQSLLEEIKSEALEVVQTEPGICDRLGYPGHHPGIYDMEKSSGSTLYKVDDKKGQKEKIYDDKEVYDASNFWMTYIINVDPLRYTEPDLVMELGMATLRNSTISEFATPEQALFLKNMEGLWPKASKIFTYTAGTLATDAILKWMSALIQDEQKIPHKQIRFAAAQNAFHGRAGLAAEVTRTSYKTEYCQRGIVDRIPDPIIIFDGAGEVLEKETQTRLDESLWHLEESYRNPNVAGAIFEFPVIAEGGALMVNDKFLGRARDLSDQYRKFLGVDCVQMYARGEYIPEEAMADADAIVVGKTSKIPAALLTDPTKRGFYKDPAMIPGKFGATWAGLECQLLTNLAFTKLIEKNNLFENGLEKMDYLYQQLKWLATSGKGILQPRIAGTYAGINLENNQARNKLVETMRDKYNIILLGAGDSAIRFSLRLDTKISEVDHLLSSLESSLK